MGKRQKEGQFFGKKKKGRPGKKERQEAQKPSKSGNTMVGELKLHRDGYGFVISAKEDEPDVFIPARYVGDAFNTDVVEIKVLPGRGAKFEGRITKIVTRNVFTLMGRFERVPQGFQVAADDRRVRHRILIDPSKKGEAKNGDNVIIRVLSHPSGNKPMTGEVMAILGKRGEEKTEKMAIIARHQLKVGFSPKVKAEAGGCRKWMTDEEISSRRDLRGTDFVTIDGETARDFDDAVAVQRLSGGIIKLYVSIADVSFFVREGTELDKAAYERSTSVYFPDDCIPMLPEEISNDLCSLVPDEERFTLTAEMDIDPAGRVVRKDFYRSVIKSKARMTYTSVRKILADKDEAERKKYAHLIPQFEIMRDCYERLKDKREKRGSIDFDLPEPAIIMDLQDREIEDIIRAERHIGHMMIEDFMIAANESVAEFLTAKRTGCIYRIHEPPPADKLVNFFELMHNLGYKTRYSTNIAPHELADIVRKIHGKPEERLVNHMLLRSLSQAIYSPENKGHYGLASKCYCHFTSPIRRYPDLVVHRLIVAALKNSQYRAPLKDISEHTSRRERVAMETEREVAKLYAALFMQNKIDEEYEGVISHVTKFGFFVELVEYFVEGLVNLDSFGDDEYRFEEKGMTLVGRRKKKIYKVGDKVRVTVTEVNIPDREISFELA